MNHIRCRDEPLVLGGGYYQISRFCSMHVNSTHAQRLLREEEG